MSHITVPQLAKMLGISRVTAYRKVKSGEIQATKVGHMYIIDDKTLSKVLSKELDEKTKHKIDKAVKKTVKEYGQVLKMLSKE
ncbi:MAG: helix-turn-helix domain-containing protein [Phycisphaerales bacterium]|jgi:excisionase family DNA binding protein